MIRLPPRRKAPRSGILRGPKRVFPRHEKFVRGHACSVPGCDDGPIEFAHVRSANNAGTGIKPPSWFGVSLCSTHHKEQHTIGVVLFQRRYGIDLWKLAETFAIRSPDISMRAAMAEQELEHG